MTVCSVRDVHGAFALKIFPLLIVSYWWGRRKYVNLNQSACSEIEGMDDALQFDALRLAVNVLHVPHETSDGAFALWMFTLLIAEFAL